MQQAGASLKLRRALRDNSKISYAATELYLEDTVSMPQATTGHGPWEGLIAFSGMVASGWHRWSLEESTGAGVDHTRLVSAVPCFC
jgi:hypothetical protein